MLSKEKKQAIIVEYGKSATDTGSPEVQVALLTARITELTTFFEGCEETFLIDVFQQSDGVVEY